MKLKMPLLLILLILLLSSLVSATTLKGTVYDANLEITENVLIEINSIPVQKFLSRDGTYTFRLSPGDYLLTVQKESLVVQEEVSIKEDGLFVYDLFLLPDFLTEEDLWEDSESQYFAEDELLDQSWPWTHYLLIGIFIFAVGRIILAWKKHGSLRIFRRLQKAKLQRMKQKIPEIKIGGEESDLRNKDDQKEEGKELENTGSKENQPKENGLKENNQLAISKTPLNEDFEPQYLDQAVEIIKKHDGRITQKELRQEMMHLSESKVSLIVTELEHKNQVEKIKKGRGNVIILKNIPNQ